MNRSLLSRKKIGEVDAYHVAKRKIGLPELDRRRLGLIALCQAAAQPDLHEPPHGKTPDEEQPVIDPCIAMAVTSVAVLVGFEAVGEVREFRQAFARVR